jgi:hypothetical protein
LKSTVCVTRVINCLGGPACIRCWTYPSAQSYGALIGHQTIATRALSPDETAKGQDRDLSPTVHPRLATQLLLLITNSRNRLFLPLGGWPHFTDPLDVGGLRREMGRCWRHSWGREVIAGEYLSKGPYGFSSQDRWRWRILSQRACETSAHKPIILSAKPPTHGESRPGTHSIG